MLLAVADVISVVTLNGTGKLIGAVIDMDSPIAVNPAVAATTYIFLPDGQVIVVPVLIVQNSGS